MSIARTPSALLTLGILVVWGLGIPDPSPVEAHRLRPAIVTMELLDEQQIDISIQLNLEAILAGVGPEHEDTEDSPNAATYDALRQETPRALVERMYTFAPEYLAGIELAFDGQRAPLELTSVDVAKVGDLAVERLSVLKLKAEIPPGADTLTWQYAAAFGGNVLRIGPAGELPVQSLWLTAGQRSEPILIEGELLPRSRWKVALDYTWLGFLHIVPLGLDHILFVLGIFLLSLHWRPLLTQVTAFTIAHSITLGLSLYGIVSLPARIVEPLIALSIVYVGVENILARDLKPWRTVVVFAFGLLHGLGFAGVLMELGLPRSEFLTALITFNVGVELGQLAVIGVAFLAVGLLFRNRSWYRRVIVIPGSAAICLVGAWWTLERTLL